MTNRDWTEPSIFLMHPKPTVPHAVKLYYFALSEDKVEEKPKAKVMEPFKYNL